MYLFDTYVSFKLEENLVVVVVAEDGVGRQSLEEDLVHGHCLLEGSQVLPAVVGGTEDQHDTITHVYSWKQCNPGASWSADI